MSTRRDYRGYDELIMLEPKLSNSRTIPAAVNFFSSSSKKVNTHLKEASKIHPIFSLLQTKKKKKATARPEFSRYIQYLREGGFGDVLQTTSSQCGFLNFASLEY
ncbi:hypothetical protein MTR67_010115 [Solanum verrucosum]|uniref:Uncharacterized protein n=1 Tax=Solanum verrucosum TaxID=315347 RepID=A0AAF0Q6Z8_SOLVR|nr:hypothetical protein MTR67_010115 [Solanum verrucosum]